MTGIRTFLERHLQSIFDSDLDTYHATSVEDLTIYEWYVTPHRIDGIPFHDFMMTEAARPDSPASVLDPSGEREGAEGARNRRFDLANYKEQVYGDCAICSYTLLVSSGTPAGVQVRAHNESRVLVRFDEGWKIAHVHKSPAWSAPFSPPGPFRRHKHAKGGRPSHSGR
jgi:hypothetical protein